MATILRLFEALNPLDRAHQLRTLGDLPRLKAGDSERLFKAAEFQASFERPPLTVEARLERGWIRATRLDSGRSEYDLFLVLKPLRPGAYESMQVVTRVAWPPQ